MQVMALDPSEAMLFGRLQQSVEGLERAVSGLNMALQEFREVSADERHAVEQRLATLENHNASAAARAIGQKDGYTAGQKSAIVAAILFVLYGVKATAVDVWELLSKVLK